MLERYTNIVKQTKQQTYLVNHITLGMPVLILAVSIDLDKLLEDSRPAASALGGVTERVVIMTIDPAIMFIVRVLGSKDGRADRAGKMFDVVLVLQGGDVASPESFTAGMANHVQSAKVVAFAERVLSAIGLGYGKKL
jgi:hypothetical protein